MFVLRLLWGLFVCSGSFVFSPISIAVLCGPGVACNGEGAGEREEGEEEGLQAIILEPEGRERGLAREDWLQGK